MNNLSTVTSTDISSLIGALELGNHLESYGDCALEAAGTNAFGPTIEGGTCPPFCRRIDDGALEAAGATMNPPIRTQIVIGTICR